MDRFICEKVMLMGGIGNEILKLTHTGHHVATSK